MTDKTQSDEMTEILAGEYVLGTLQGESRRRFEERLGDDPVVAAAVSAWERRFSPLLPTDDNVEHPDHLWAGIEAQLGNEPGSAEVVTVRAIEGEWQSLAPGVEAKVLHLDAAENMQSILLRMAAGSRFPAHDHPSDEECLMLSGDLTFGDLTLRTGDYHRVPRGVPHSEGVSQEGAVLFVRAQIV